MDTERYEIKKPDPTQPTAPLPPVKPPAEPEPGKTEIIVELPEKKKGSLLLPLLMVALLAAALLAGYSFVHIWDGGSCTAPAVCRICGMEKDSGITHIWTGTSCLEPRMCTICGAAEAEAPGHSPDADGICTVCGEAEPRTDSPMILKQNGSRYQVELLFDGETYDLTVRVADYADFAENSVSIKDYTGEAVNPERYTVSRDGDAVVFHLPRDLAPGEYTICSGYLEDHITDFCFGWYDTFLPTHPDSWHTDFETKSWKWDRYLTLGAESLVTTESVDAATRFSSPWDIGTVKVTDGTASISTSGTGSWKCLCSVYSSISESSLEEEVFVFDYDGWFLASDEVGQVYLTQTLTDDCYWVITSSM